VTQGRGLSCGGGGYLTKERNSTFEKRKDDRRGSWCGESSRGKWETALQGERIFKNGPPPPAGRLEKKKRSSIDACSQGRIETVS